MLLLLIVVLVFAILGLFTDITPPTIPTWLWVFAAIGSVAGIIAQVQKANKEESKEEEQEDKEQLGIEEEKEREKLKIEEENDSK